MLNEPQNHIRCMVTGQIIPDQQHAQRWQRGGQGQGLPQAALPDLPQGGLRRRITGVGGGKVSKIAAHCALSQGCKTALVALVTPWMRTAPERG